MSEKYSFEQAQDEAAKIREIAGESPDYEDIALAEELVDNEILDHYRSFESRFFHSKYVGQSPEVDRQQIDEAAERYKKLLSAPEIESCLSSIDQVVSRELMMEIRDLVRQERKFCGVMSKKSEVSDRKWFLNQLGIDLDSDHLPYFVGRAINHFYRLRFPEIYEPFESANEKIYPTENQFCADFTEDYLRWVQSLKKPSEREARIIRDAIGTESEGVAAFWTLAPYISDEFKHAGKTSLESIENLMKIIKQGERALNEYLNGGMDHYYRIFEFAILPYDLTPRSVEILGYDDRMPSHLLARIQAKKIVRRFLSN